MCNELSFYCISIVAQSKDGVHYMSHCYFLHKNVSAYTMGHVFGCITQTLQDILERCNL